MAVHINAVLEAVAQDELLLTTGGSLTRGPQRKNGGFPKRKQIRPERLRRHSLAWRWRQRRA